jgi:uncharacterized membrane protein
MDQTLNRAADMPPFPAVRRVEASRPFVWLKRGVADLLRVPKASFGYGAIVALIGVLLLTVSWDATYLAPALLGGFLLVAPFLAIVFYVLSRQLERGGEVDTDEALLAWRRNANSIALFGLLLVLSLILWERTSAIIFALFYGGRVTNVETLVNDVLFSGQYTALLVAYFGIGGLVAAAVFALGVVTAPLLVDREVDVVTAVVTSVKVCLRNPAAMIVWAATIAVLTLIGFATLMIGLVLVFPVIGHATWHAYRDLVAPAGETSAPGQ